MSYTTGPRGSAFADGVRIGKVQNSAYQSGEPGIRTSALYTYEILPSALSANALVTTVVPIGAQFLALAPNGAATTATVVNGVAAVSVDYARVLTLSVVANSANFNLFVQGLDAYGQLVVDEIICTTNVNNVTLLGNKAFKTVLQIWVTAATTTAITVGVSDVFGLPYVMVDEAYVVESQSGALNNFVRGTTTAMVAGSLTVANTPGAVTVATGAQSLKFLPAGAFIQLQHLGTQATRANGGVLYQGAVVSGISFVVNSANVADVDTVAFYAPGVYQVQGADTTFPATPLTNDVRGLFGVATPSDGATSQIITYYVVGADGEFPVNNQAYIALQGPAFSDNQTLVNLFGVPQNKTGGPFTTVPIN